MACRDQGRAICEALSPIARLSDCRRGETDYHAVSVSASVSSIGGAIGSNAPVDRDAEGVA